MSYDLEALFTEMADRYYPDISAYGIDFRALLKAVAKRESNFNPSCVTPEKDGDYSIGLMQVTISRARKLWDFGSKTNDQVKTALLEPRFNLYIAGQYLVNQTKRYNGNVKFIISSYNAGTAMFNIDGKVIYWDPKNSFFVLDNGRPPIIPVSGYDESLLDTYKIWNVDYVNYVVTAYNGYVSGTGEKKTLKLRLLRSAAG